jgi:hypothetical protein
LADAGSEETRWSTLQSVATIIAADAVMSLDNVVTIARPRFDHRRVSLRAEGH